MDVRGGRILAQLAEELQQGYSVRAQVVVDPSASAVRLHQAGAPQPRQVLRYRRGAGGERPGELGGGAGRTQALEDRGTPSTERGVEGILRWRPAGLPERGHPAWAVDEGGLPGRVAYDVKVGPSEGDRDQEHPAPLRVHLLLPPLVYLDGAPVVAHRPVQPGEQRLGTLKGQRAGAPEHVPLQQGVQARPVGGQHPLVVAEQRLRQAPHRAAWISQVSPQLTGAIRTALVDQASHLHAHPLRRGSTHLFDLRGEVRERRGRGRREEVRYVALGLHQDPERPQIQPTQLLAGPCHPGQVDRVPGRVHERPAARHHLPQRAEGEARLHQILGRGADPDHLPSRLPSYVLWLRRTSVAMFWKKTNTFTLLEVRAKLS